MKGIKTKILGAGLGVAALAAAATTGAGVEAVDCTVSVGTTAGQACSALEVTVNAHVQSYVAAEFTHTVDSTTVGTGDGTVAVTGSTQLNTAGATQVTVATNDRSGYTLSVQDQDTNTALAASGITETIAASDSIGTDGSYGWAVKASCENGATSCNESWAAVPSSSATALTLAKTSGMTSSSSTTVTYGVRVSELQPAGTYTDTVIYTVTANGN